MKTNLLTLILLSLWIPVTLDKIINFESFKTGLLRQPFSENFTQFLIYALPFVEGLTITLLLLSTLRKWGFVLSTILMLAFTVYIGVALLGAWEKLPCGCGSVITSMTWKQHFFFNLFFLLISGWGFYLMNLKRGRAVEGETAEGWPAKRPISFF